MNDPAEDLAARALLKRKRRDEALILPLAGLFLFVSPLIGLFANSGTFWGFPMILLYIIIVWLALIYAANRLAVRIMDDADNS